MDLSNSKSRENIKTDGSKVYPEQKKETKHDAGIPSHLIWSAVIIVVASVLVCSLLYNTKLWPKGDKQELHKVEQEKQQPVLNQGRQTKESDKPLNASNKSEHLIKSQKSVEERSIPSEILKESKASREHEKESSVYMGTWKDDKGSQKTINENSFPLKEDKESQEPSEKSSEEDKASEKPTAESSTSSETLKEDKTSQKSTKENQTPSGKSEEDRTNQKPVEESSNPSDTLKKDKGSEQSKKKSQKSVKETSKSVDSPNKDSRRGKQKIDPSAALTNKYDANISKDIKKANKLLEKGRFEDALRRFGNIIEQHPKSPRAHYGKAQALDKLSEKRQSNELLQEAIDAYAKVPDVLDCPLELTKLALSRMGERLNFFGKMRQAAQVYEKLSKLFPDDLEILNELGVQYIMYGNNKGAKRTFRKVLKINPNNGFAKSHLGFILKSELKYEESIPLLRQGIQSGEPRSDDGRFYFHLGDALGRIGKAQEAYDVYVEAANKGIFLSPLQRSLYNADTPLRARPWWRPQDTGYIDAFRKLESNWKTIRDEGLAIMDEKTGGFLPEEENLREKGDWLQFTLYQQGRKIKSNCRKTPKTCAIMDTIPESTGCRRGQVKFSVMHPGTHLWPHTGPTNCRLRSHLGLVIPKSVAIRVGETTRTWDEGKIIVIDDSIEHEVWHNGTSLRLIFIADFWHPDLTLHQRATLSPI